MGKATHTSLLILTARQPDESIKESTSAIGRATSICSFSPVDLFRLPQAAETNGGNSRCRAIVLSARKESCRNQGDTVDDFFLLRFLSVRLLPRRRVLGHLMLQGRVRQVSRLVLRRAYVHIALQFSWFRAILGPGRLSDPPIGIFSLRYQPRGTAPCDRRLL
jgi:hypothetical protein